MSNIERMPMPHQIREAIDEMAETLAKLAIRLLAEPPVTSEEEATAGKLILGAEGLREFKRLQGG